MSNIVIKPDGKYNESFLAIQKYFYDPSGKAILSPEHEKVLDRWTYVDRLIRMQYIHEMNVPAHLMKQYGISRSTAFEDIRNAKRIFGKVNIEDQVYYSKIHYAYALEEFKKCQLRRDANGASKFLRLMQLINMQMNEGVDEKLLELAKMVESTQIMFVVDDPTKAGFKHYDEDYKKKLLSELMIAKAQDVDYTEVK